MATIYAEAVLAQETRIVKEDGSVLGGPVYYIRKAYKGGFGKFLSVFFAIAITLALGFMGSMVQSNSIAEACNTASSYLPNPLPLNFRLRFQVCRMHFQYHIP